MMSQISFIDILLLTPIALASALFCIFLAIGVGYISFSKKVPRTIFWIAILTQAGLSVGIFVMAILWYYSQVTPEGMPKDFITGAAIAYTAGAFPGTTLGMLVILFSILRTYLKKFLKGQGDNELEDIMPSLKMQALIDRYYQDVRRMERSEGSESSLTGEGSKKPRRKPKNDTETESELPLVPETSPEKQEKDTNKVTEVKDGRTS